VPLVFAAIAPHGGIAIKDEVAAVTRAGMEELGRLLDEARPDAVVVTTPHNVHIANALGVIVASRVAGKLDGMTPAVELDVPSDMELAWRLLEALGDAGLSAAAVSFGSNDPGTAVAPMDWGVLIPLWFMGGRHDPPVPIVVVTPARDLPASDHVTAGAAIASVAAQSERRVALIASADHGHAHVKGGPFGYHPAAAEYDALISEIIRSNELDRLSSISPTLVENAKADSWWQMLILHGATRGWPGRFISYEAPTYFGMLTAAFWPALS
jgi:aromatic ring-opening dioxygenase LigB subunit